MNKNVFYESESSGTQAIYTLVSGGIAETRDTYTVIAEHEADYNVTTRNAYLALESEFNDIVRDQVESVESFTPTPVYVYLFGISLVGLACTVSHSKRHLQVFMSTWETLQDQAREDITSDVELEMYGFGLKLAGIVQDRIDTVAVEFKNEAEYANFIADRMELNGQEACGHLRRGFLSSKSDMQGLVGQLAEYLMSGNLEEEANNPFGDMFGSLYERPADA